MIMRILLILLLFFQLKSVALACESASECSDLYVEIATASRGISREEVLLAKKMLSFSEEAIPFLLELLLHERRDVRRLASYTLRDIEGLNENHLDALINSRLKGDGWIPPAIARIGGEKAITFLVEELKKEKQTHTQLTYAFELLGASAVPYLVELYECKEGCDEDLFNILIFLFQELEENANSAILPLLEIAQNKVYSEKARQFAVLTLGAIGIASQFVVPDLKRLQEKEPKIFSGYVENAILNIGSTEAVEIWVKRLKGNPDKTTFRDIAKLGKNGHDIGPFLMEYIEHENWDFRIGAVRALGYIGYKPSLNELIKLLGDKNDWRLVYVSVIAIEQLMAEPALEALEKVAKEHWYPPVREVAEDAIVSIKTQTGYVSKFYPKEFPAEFFSYVNAGREMSPCEQVNFKKDPEENKFNAKDHPSEIELLTYKAKIIVFGPPPGKESGPIVEHAYDVDQKPNIALKLGDSWLVGTDRGEWGGELVLMEPGEDPVFLMNENIDNIHTMSFGIVAVSGLAHLSSNKGVLFKVKKININKWGVSIWKILPGAPISSWLVEGGSLLINTNSGTVIVSPEGEISMAKCSG